MKPALKEFPARLEWPRQDAAHGVAVLERLWQPYHQRHDAGGRQRPRGQELARARAGAADAAAMVRQERLRSTSEAAGVAARPKVAVAMLYFLFNGFFTAHRL